MPYIHTGLLPYESSTVEVEYHPAMTNGNGEQLLQPVIEIAWSAGGFVRLSISVHEARAIARDLTAALATHDRTVTNRQE
ncbi:hypothetical protein OHB26_09565 [Nocardia sp. NBC_01503]|uniref:hypothetical protein n=1 Tax=Nocardia sp. NBC_01503 TaxID=2975997 RepID=UPI002E7BF26E|nr:hypothetical protein [Nocardia sp. NBC_01503]WTL34423.1 hypothetical protein OHB26_09565 [Nocardia sp. NBC_01503]